jgi:lysophospholipase L1-like esterase
MRRSFRFIGIVALGLAGIALLLVSAEMLYRRRTERQDARSQNVRYYRHARMQRALVRDSDYGGVVHINRHGFRGPDFDAKKPAGTTRIIVVGASTTFDPCARNDAETWPARLEHWLNHLSGGRRFQVINAGVSGTPMLDHLIRLETELHQFDADVFIVYANHGIVSAADAFADTAVTSPMPEAAPSVSQSEQWLRSHSLLYSRLRPEWQTVPVSRKLNDEDWKRAVAFSAADFQRNLKAFSVVAKSQGAEVVLAEINRVTGNRAPKQFSNAERAVWENAYPTPPEVVHAGYQRFHEVWRAVADSTGALFVPADSIGITGSQNFCDSDPIHFNSRGSDLMGRRMAELLLARSAVLRKSAD